MTEKEVLQSAADEARKAARAAREAASVLDDYAKYLVQPSFRVKATAMHATATNKLKTASDALAASNRWIENALKAPVTLPERQIADGEAASEQDAPLSVKASAIRVKKGGTK